MTSPSLATVRARRYRGFMMPRVTSLRATHLVLWSSPILLLVLVFSVSGSPKTITSARGAATNKPAMGHRTVPTTTEMTTSTLAATAPRPARTSSVAPTRRALATATSDAPSPTTTAATAPRAASSLVASAASGALVGDLVSAGATEDVPLQGPGTWLVQSSAPMLAQLSCPGSTQPVSTTLSINALVACRLHLISASAGPVRWQIVPTP